MIKLDGAISLKKYNELIYYKVDKVSRYFYKYYNRFFLKMDIVGVDDITLSKTTHIFLFDFDLYQKNSTEYWQKALQCQMDKPYTAPVFIYERHGRVTDIMRNKTAAKVLDNLNHVCAVELEEVAKTHQNLPNMINCIVDFFEVNA